MFSNSLNTLCGLPNANRKAKKDLTKKFLAEKYQKNLEKMEIENQPTQKKTEKIPTHITVNRVQLELFQEMLNLHIKGEQENKAEGDIQGNKIRPV